MVLLKRKIFTLAALTMGAASFLAFSDQKDIADSVLKRPIDATKIGIMS